MLYQSWTEYAASRLEQHISSCNSAGRSQEHMGNTAENSCFLCVAFRSCLAQHVELLLVKLTDVEVANDDAKAFRVAWSMIGNTSKSLAQVPLTQAKFHVNINDRHIISIHLQFNDMVSSTADDLVRYDSLIR